MEVERVSIQTKKTRCLKCNGLIVFDMILGDDGGWVDDVRCVNCGERFFNPDETQRNRSRRYYGRDNVSKTNRTLS